MQAAANAILNGPQSADGKVLAGLVRRRKQEATLFLLPDNISIYGDGTV
jgi:GH24 family phage-related lysozyme (muramidase)